MYLNYQDYRKFKEELNLAEYKRLDCMNPFKAMSFIQPTHKSVNETEALEYIASISEYPGRISLSSGVRGALKTLFEVYKSSKVYIPNEVYPVYFDLLDTSSNFCHYSIFDESALEDVQDSVILYTLNHFGELDLDNKKAESLISKGNILAIDAVYDYDFGLRKFYSLVDSGKCFILSSFSKTQLCRNFGYVFHKSDINFESPQNYYCFDEGIPQKQLSFIKERWEQIQSSLDFKLVDSKHPYFKLVDRSFEELLKMKILGIPLSVFSKFECAQDKTVVSCLYEIDKYVG